MDMWVLILAVFCCYVGVLQACIPGFRYIPATTPSEEKKRLINATDCGRKGGSYQDRIVGGTFAAENEFPWQVALLRTILQDDFGGPPMCGAILLSCDPVIVITAAHCVSPTQLYSDLSLPIPYPAKLFQVAFGVHTLDSEKLDKKEVRLDVEEIIIHPSFVRYTAHIGVSQRNNIQYVSNWENDIAVLKVKTDSGFQCKKDSIWPACLPRKENYYNDYMGIVTGWGTVNTTTGNRSKTLKKAMASISTNACGANSKNQVCAADIKGDGAFCGGDSGGPLVVKDMEEDAWSAVGIVSHGQTGCDSNIWGVYTRVGQYLEWISNQFGLLPPL